MRNIFSNWINLQIWMSQHLGAILVLFVPWLIGMFIIIRFLSEHLPL